jgi:N-acetyl-gamma-glutamylphosphate reductase
MRGILQAAPLCFDNDPTSPTRNMSREATSAPSMALLIRGEDRFIVISCLDNLVEVRAGPAVQNMNLTFDLPQTAGLEALAICH